MMALVYPGDFRMAAALSAATRSAATHLAAARSAAACSAAARSAAARSAASRSAAAAAGSVAAHSAASHSASRSAAARSAEARSAARSAASRSAAAAARSAAACSLAFAAIHLTAAIRSVTIYLAIRWIPAGRREAVGMVGHSVLPLVVHGCCQGSVEEASTICRWWLLEYRWYHMPTAQITMFERIYDGRGHNSQMVVTLQTSQNGGQTQVH